MKFRRNTHDEQGHLRPFPREAMLFWQTLGGEVADVLRHEVALTFDEVYTAYTEYMTEHEPYTPAGPEHVRWCLAQLIQRDLAVGVGS